MPTYTITADSVPDYDNWGPDDYWSCNDWITWHKELKKKYTKAEADKKWIAAWEQQGGTEHNANWCKYSGSFNEYVRKEKLDVSNFIANILNDATTVIENAGDTAVSATKILKWVVPGIVIAAAIGVLFYAAKKFNVI